MKEWEWQLVNEHIENFNIHILARLYPSEKLYVDEIFIRWYRLGGDWVNLGLTHYVQMDHKPDYGCEIQETCFGSGMVMMKLELVKGNTAGEAAVTADGTEPSGDVKHGTKVLKELVDPW